MLSPQSPRPEVDGLSLQTTRDLLVRAHTGDRRSIEVLFERCLPALRRWARGRLPAVVGDIAETQDFVQETLLHTFNQLHTLESRHQGALQAYLRQALADRIRHSPRRSDRVGLINADADTPSPLEQAVGREGVERYEAALARLQPAEREAIVARLELQQSYEEVAIALGQPAADAARAAVTSALSRLLEEMDHGR